MLKIGCKEFSKIKIYNNILIRAEVAINLGLTKNVIETS